MYGEDRKLSTGWRCHISLEALYRNHDTPDDIHHGQPSKTCCEEYLDLMNTVPALENAYAWAAVARFDERLNDKACQAIPHQTLVY